jgi:hypothetical protein
MEPTPWISCDICPAQAVWLARGTSGELSFCNHHYTKNSEALDKWAYEMVELNKKEAIPQLTETAVK